MTFCLIPNNDIDCFHCNNTFWSTLLCDTPVGFALKISRSNKGGYHFIPDKNGLSPLDNAILDDNGEEYYYEVTVEQAKQIADATQLLMNTANDSDINQETYKEFYQFAKYSEGFIIW